MAEETCDQLREQVALQVTELEKQDLCIREVCARLMAEAPEGAETCAAAPIRGIAAQLAACLPGGTDGDDAGDDLEAYVHVLLEAKRNMTQSTRAARAENEQLSRRAAELRSDIETLAGSLQGLRTDSDTKRAELATLATRIAKETTAVNTIQAEVRKRTAEADRIQQENAAKLGADLKKLERCSAECAERVAKKEQAESRIADAAEVRLAVLWWCWVRMARRRAGRAECVMRHARMRAWHGWARVAAACARCAQRGHCRAVRQARDARMRAWRAWARVAAACAQCAQRARGAHCRAVRQAYCAQSRCEHGNTRRCMRAWRRLSTRTWQRHLRRDTLLLRQAVAGEREQLHELALMAEAEAQRLPCPPGDTAPRVYRNAIRVRLPRTVLKMRPPVLHIPARRAGFFVSRHPARRASSCARLGVELVRTEAAVHALHSTLSTARAILHESLERAHAHCVGVLGGHAG